VAKKNGAETGDSTIEAVAAPKKRGRPKGSKNKGKRGRPAGSKNKKGRGLGRPMGNGTVPAGLRDAITKIVRVEVHAALMAAFRGL